MGSNDEKECIFSKRDYFDHLLTLTPSSVYWKDLNGVYLGCNSTMLEMLEASSVEEVIGKTDYDLPWYRSAKELQINDQMVISSRKLMHFEETGKLGDGTIVTVVSNKMPLLNKAGKIIGTLGSSIDITELKAAQKKAETSNEAKSEN